MKRILGTIILGLSALLLTGCDDRNNVEKTLFDQCSAVNKLSCESEYSSTLSSLNCGGNVCNPKETHSVNQWMYLRLMTECLNYVIQK